ncbi:MAG TPA: oligosaccharide flippase family protein [Kofleriaceae bacterium]|nr:oligosaccharide flippase family protein [Kofleriaceae bacterium]
MAGELDAKLRRGTTLVGVASGLTGALDLISNLVCLWLWVSPAELGIATMAAALFPVLERIAALGLPVAMVRRADDDRRALSSMFWLALAASFVVLGLALALAPAIGRAFHHPIVGGLVAAYAAKLCTQNLHFVPEAQLRRALRFGTLSRIRVTQQVVDTAAKLAVAYLGGHGHPDLRIWCFAIGPIAGSLALTIGLQLAQPWRPALAFDSREALAAVRFGAQLSLSDLLYFAYTSCDYVVVGAAFGDAALGAYRLAYEMVLDVVRLVSLVTGEVALPAFARIAGDAREVGVQLVKLTRQNLVAVAPVLVVIAVAADDLLAILYPPLEPAAPTAVRILCGVGALRAASFVLPPMLAGLGRARAALAYNAIAAVVCPAAFALAAALWPAAGFVSVAWAWLASYPIAFCALLAMALSIAGVRGRDYARGVLPVAGWAAAALCAAVAARLALPAIPLVRAGGTALATLAVYGAILLAVRSRRRST